LSQKRQLIERLQEDPGPEEREQIEHLLAKINKALDLLDGTGTTSRPLHPRKFTRERSAARKLAQEYFQRFPKDRYHTEVESWRLLQSANIEFTMKRLREPEEH
jgi:hypothetical protein